MRRACSFLSMGFVLLALARHASADGADVILGVLGQPEVYATNGDVVALSFGTTSCNAGDAVLEWHKLPENRHPVISQNMYRLFQGRMEQIGQSWVKHGFVALQGSVCKHSRDPDFPYETCQPNPDGTGLGIGCSDPYNTQINRGPNLGPRNLINPLTGEYPGSKEQVEHTHQHPLGIEHGVQVKEEALGQFDAGARYFIEGQYVAPDDATAGNGLNNVSFREVEVRKVDGTWRFGFTADDTVRRKPAILAWDGASFSTIETTEAVLGQKQLKAKVIVAQSVQQVEGTSTYRYEYALYNMNNPRGLKSFSVPVGNLGVTGIGFSAPPAHVEDKPRAPWQSSVQNGLITWSAPDEQGSELNWGTTFNFWFETSAPPTDSVAQVVPSREGMGGNVYTATIKGPAPSATSIVVSNPNEVIRFMAAALNKQGGASGALVPFSEPKTFQPFIAQGDEAQATAYYARIGTDLGFDVPNSTLNDLLVFLGYKGLLAQDLEQIDSSLLHPQTEDDFASLAAVVADKAAFDGAFDLADFAGGQVIASRFLAPKIANITGNPPYQAGWRKLVRIQSRENSGAKAAGVASAYILFNYLRPQSEAAPFPGPGSDPAVASGNNQVMLIPDASVTFPSTDSMYWIVYGPRASNYAVTPFLAAAFDLPTGDSATDFKYYVPTACAECHGGQKFATTFPRAKLNFLDTDHWHDRTASPDFFSEAGATAGVLFDGGVDTSTEKYAAAFEVVRRINQEILVQNQRADQGVNRKSNQLLGVEKWLELHASSADHKQPIERVLLTGSQTWDANKPADVALLGLLNKHCYRCHSSVRYNVFDKEQVIRNVEDMILLLQIGSMPQGHDLRTHEPAEFQDLVKYLQQLQ